MQTKVRLTNDEILQWKWPATTSWKRRKRVIPRQKAKSVWNDGRQWPKFWDKKKLLPQRSSIIRHCKRQNQNRQKRKETLLTLQTIKNAFFFKSSISKVEKNQSEAKRALREQWRCYWRPVSRTRGNSTPRLTFKKKTPVTDLAKSS